MAYFIIFILSASLIIFSALILSSAKKYLCGADGSCFAALRDRFIISWFLFLPMLAVLGFMLLTDFTGTIFTLLFLTGTVYFMVPLLFFGSFSAAVILWICSAARYGKARKEYQKLNTK